MKREEWNYEISLEHDRRVERRLPVKEFFVFLIVLAVLAIRIFLG